MQLESINKFELNSSRGGITLWNYLAVYLLLLVIYLILVEGWDLFGNYPLGVFQMAKKTVAALKADIATQTTQLAALVNDNTQGDISPADLRTLITSMLTLLTDMADSFTPLP